MTSQVRPAFFLLITLPLMAQLPPLASTQRVLFENADVRVSELNMAPGDHEGEHRHARGVTVALSAYDNQVVALPAKTVTNRQTAFGETRWAEPSHHETRNTGKTHQRVIRMELKNPTPASTPPLDALDSVISAKATQRVLFENADVRVIEERVPPGVAQPKHRHRKGLLIPLADAELEIASFPADNPAGPASPKARRQLKFANATWAAPAVHEVANVGATEARNVRIEVK